MDEHISPMPAHDLHMCLICLLFTKLPGKEVTKELNWQH